MITENITIDGKYWLSGFGNTEGPIMIVSSFPSYQDVAKKQLHFESNNISERTNADELMQACESVGIKPENCWFTTMVKYSIGNKEKPSPEQIEECFAALDEEIAEVKPKLIIALGAEPFKRLMKQNIKQSDYLGEIIESPYGPLMVNYSPGQVNKVDPKLRPVFVDNFHLAKRYVDDELKYEDFTWEIIRTPEENINVLNKYINEGRFTIGYDAEWKGKYGKDEVMYTFQYSCEPGKAYILPIINEDRTENLALLNSMKVMLEHPKADRVGWNIRADDKRLRQRGFNLPEHTLGFDGMKAVAFYDSRWGKGLEVGIRRFTNYKPYYNRLTGALKEHKLAKEEMSELFFLDNDIFMEYCAGDAVSHYTACVNMRRGMNTRVPKEVRDYYFNTYLPLSNYLLDMEEFGMPINVEVMRTLTEQYKVCSAKLQERLIAHTKALGFDTARYETSVAEIGEEQTKLNGLRPDFNPRSYIDKNYLFFDVLGLTPEYYVKKGKTKPRAWYVKAKKETQAQYNPSANGKSMASIRFKLAAALAKDPEDSELQKKYDIVSTYLDLARVSVFSNKFFSTQGVTTAEGFDDEDADDEEPLKSSYWAALCPDGRIHADFYECLDNFRSSSKPNVQNPASKVLSHIPGIFKKFELETPKNIRNIFYSGHPDWYFAEVDVAGADLAIAAFLSKDPDYINDILRGGFHTTKMREYFKDSTLTKDHASKYVTSKAITFRVAYTAGLMSAAIPIQAEIFAESGEYVDIKLIEHALKTWERYKVYIDYRDQCAHEVKALQRITNARGMVFNFEDTNEMGIQSGWINQSLAFPIASELALFMWDISVQLKNAMIADKVWKKWVYPVNVVHDANYWVIHKDLMNDSYFPEICKQYFTEEVKIATGDNLGMEMVVADCWKGKHKIFSKETKWNFSTKSWEWEK